MYSTESRVVVSTVLEEITESEITQSHVMRRIDDWQQRIDALYSQIEHWLPAGYSISRGRTVSMHEELMKKFSVPPRDLPVLKILRNAFQARRCFKWVERPVLRLR
jgi:hypothetical protein